MFLVKIFKTILIFAILRLLSPIYCRIYSAHHNYRAWQNIKSRWILINNATSEQGLAFCDALASRKCKLIILGENAEKLAVLKSQLELRTKVVVYKIIFDSCKNFEFLEKYNIGLAINMIGYPENLSSNYDSEEVAKSINRHVTGTILLSKTLINYMKEQRSGYIINIFYIYNRRAPSFNYKILRLARSAVSAWAMAVQYELIYDKIWIENMDCGLLSLKNNSEEYSILPSLFSPTPQIFAESVLQIFGNNLYTVPYFPHFIGYLFSKLFPSLLIHKVARLMYSRKINEF